MLVLWGHDQEALPHNGPGDIKKKAEKDERFESQVLRMSAVKLGWGAKHFYPQEVVKQTFSGMRVETRARALSARRFRDENGIAPDAVGANCILVTAGTGAVLPFYLDRDPDEPPKVTIWHDELMCVKERRTSTENQFEEDGAGSVPWELADVFGEALWWKALAVCVPQLKAQAEALKAGGAPVLVGPTTADAQTPTAKRKLIDTGSGLPKRQRQSRRASILGQDLASIGGGASKHVAKDTSTLPPLADCVMGTAGRGRLSGLQVLYHCLQYIDGAGAWIRRITSSRKESIA